MYFGRSNLNIYSCAVLSVVVLASASASDNSWSDSLPPESSILNLVQVHYNDTRPTTVPPSGITTWSSVTTGSSTINTTNNNNNSPSADSCDCVCGVPNRKHRIVGGLVTRVNEFPWVVALTNRGKFYCGGTLVSRHHVITAAHCIDGIDTNGIRVFVGEHDRLNKTESETEERRIVSSQVHSGFSLATFNHDIAVLKLDSPVDFGPSIRPACLPQEVNKNYTGRVAIVAGWGRIDEKKPTSRLLRKVAVPIMSKETCQSAGYAKNRITDNMICAGYSEGKKDACQGDSGGPLHLDGDGGSMEVVGIVSWGRGCARPNFPGIYTRVVNYLDWVTEHLQGDCACSPPQ